MNDEKRVLADMPELLTLAPSPHVRRGVTTRRLMVDVLLALAPAAVFGVVAFGWRAAVILLLATGAAILAEYLAEKILHRPVTVSDCSAAVTVTDRGQWRTVPAPGDRGRGLPLMRALTDSVAVAVGEREHQTVSFDST